MGVHADAYHSVARTLYKDGLPPELEKYEIPVDGSYELHDLCRNKHHVIGYRCHTLDPNGKESSHYKYI